MAVGKISGDRFTTHCWLNTVALASPGTPRCNANNRGREMKARAMRAVFAATVFLGVSAVAPAFASDTDTKSVDNADTCTHGTGWASQGAFTLTTADDQVYWSSIHHLTVNRANGVT